MSHIMFYHLSILETSISKTVDHSRPQAEADEMKKDFETILVSSWPMLYPVHRENALDGSMGPGGFLESAGSEV